MQNDAITLDDFLTGVGQSVGEVTVVGYDEQALAVLVEAARTKEALAPEFGWEQVEDSAFGVGIGVGAEHALRLVHDECDRALFFAQYRFVVDENSGIWGRFVSQLSDFPIHADIALFDLALGLAA